MEMVTRYGWPGNVRELVNTMETAISATQGEQMLFSRHLPDDMRIQVVQASLADMKPGDGENRSGAGVGVSMTDFKSYRKTALDRAEKKYLQELVTLAGGDVQAACRIANLSRSRYYELIKQHDIPIP
jgi:DNA-binding NtrC family response regulator